MTKTLEFEISAESLAIIRDGQAALRWLDRDKTWEAWSVSARLSWKVRTVAMQRAGTNRPFGPLYRDLFGRLLRQFKFIERIRTAARSRPAGRGDGEPAGDRDLAEWPDR